MHDLSGGAVFEYNNYIAAAVHCTVYIRCVKFGPPVHNYEHEAGSYGDGFT